MKKRRKRKPAQQAPPTRSGDRSGIQPAPRTESGRLQFDPLDELFDEDRLDYLDNLARTPQERRRTDLLLIGVLVLLCGLLALLVVILLHYHHRHF